METIIESGIYEVLESKFLFLDEPQSELIIHLTINDMKFGDIKVRFVSRENEGHSIEAKVENYVLILTCINFNEALGTGTTHPVDIGTLEGKKVRLHLWSYLLGNGTVRKVEYSIFREK